MSPITEEYYIIECKGVLPHFVTKLGVFFVRCLRKLTGSQKHHHIVRLAIVNSIKIYQHPPALSNYFVKYFEMQVGLTSPALCQAACKDYVSKNEMS